MGDPRKAPLLAAYAAAVAAGHAPQGGKIGTGRRSAMMVAAEACGLSRTVAWRLLREAEVPAPPAADIVPAAPPEPVDRRQLRGLRAEVDRLRGALAEREAAEDMADAVRQAASGLRRDPLPPPDWAVRVRATSGDAPGVPMIDLGDWHIGETVDPGQMHGVNAFNADVSDARVRRLVDRVLLLAFKHMHAPEYPGAVIILGGDFVSGWLHEELVATDWCTPLQAMRWCVSRLRWVLDRLTEAFGRLYVVAVPGNHGRLMKRTPGKLSAFQSFDWLIYGMLQDGLADHPQITMAVPNEGEWLFQVAGTRYLVMHGHELGVKGGDGIIGAIGPIMRGATKVGRSERSILRHFDTLVLHHFHQHLWLPGVIVNDTFKGFDEWARKQRYNFSAPSQTLWFSHPRWGPNLPLRVFLEDPPALEAVPFVALPQVA
jgi:hypothetical protein